MPLRMHKKMGWPSRNVYLKNNNVIRKWVGLCTIITINSYYINSNFLLITVNAIPTKSTRQANREKLIIQVLIRALLKRKQQQEGKSVGLNIRIRFYSFVNVSFHIASSTDRNRFRGQSPSGERWFRAACNAVFEVLRIIWRIVIRSLIIILRIGFLHAFLLCTH